MVILHLFWALDLLTDDAFFIHILFWKKFLVVKILKQAQDVVAFYYESTVFIFLWSSCATSTTADKNNFYFDGLIELLSSYRSYLFEEVDHYFVLLKIESEQKEKNNKNQTSLSVKIRLLSWANCSAPEPKSEREGKNILGARWSHIMIISCCLFSHQEFSPPLVVEQV